MIIKQIILLILAAMLAGSLSSCATVRGGDLATVQTAVPAEQKAVICCEVGKTVIGLPCGIIRITAVDGKKISGLRQFCSYWGVTAVEVLPGYHTVHVAFSLNSGNVSYYSKSDKVLVLEAAAGRKYVIKANYSSDLSSWDPYIL